MSKMTDRDRNIFFCDLKKLNWDDYFREHYKGVRVYLLKDPMSTVPEARKRWNRFVADFIFLIYLNNSDLS